MAGGRSGSLGVLLECTRGAKFQSDSYSQKDSLPLTLGFFS